MDHNFNFNKQISSSKCFCGILYILIAMLLSQLFAVLLSEALLSMGIGGAMCNIISGILYVIFTLAATAGMCCLFKTHLSEMRITPLKIKPIWLASAFIIPLLTIGGFLLAGGFWETNIRSSETSLMIITAAVAFS